MRITPRKPTKAQIAAELALANQALTAMPGSLTSTVPTRIMLVIRV